MFITLIGFNTDENEPLNIWGSLTFQIRNLNLSSPRPASAAGARVRAPLRLPATTPAWQARAARPRRTRRTFRQSIVHSGSVFCVREEIFLNFTIAEILAFSVLGSVFQVNQLLPAQEYKRYPTGYLSIAPISNVSLLRSQEIKIFSNIGSF